MSASLLKYLLTDDDSLNQYLQGEVVTIDDAKRRLFLKAREKDREIPDHHYRLQQEKSFKNYRSICEIYYDGIADMAAEFLAYSQNRVHVQSEMQNDWQELLTYLPPLLMQAAFLEKKIIPAFSNLEIRGYYTRYILPNTQYTAIPSPAYTVLSHLIDEKKGFLDLHMHLNGSLEVDWVWQDYLKEPDTMYRDFVSAYNKPGVREQLEQESHLLSPHKYLTLLKCAQKLRVYFYDYLNGQTTIPIKSYKRTHLVNFFLDNTATVARSHFHPFAQVITGSDSYSHLLSVECLMYVMLLREIRNNKNETLAGFFHFYLLILGLTNRLLVQQVHQNGFEQFQKITINGLREESERTYFRRYFQMHGNDLKYIRFLEGRFSPKSTRVELTALADAIRSGWEKMKKYLAEIKNHHTECVENPELKLIAHFIKKKEDGKSDSTRHKTVRHDIWNRARVISLLLKNYPKYRSLIVGIDAASSEFDAPPEVFAPTFRLMRRSGIKHFTYHAGEDFYHLMSGLRAIYEAIVFCDLQSGNRIGHATAAGLSPILWQKKIGGQLLIRKGEYLDDLVFVYHLIVEEDLKELAPMIPSISNRISNLGFEIYGQYFPPSTLLHAWKMRQCCPEHTLIDKKSLVELKSNFDEFEWEFPIRKGFLSSRNNLQINPAWSIFQAYHTKACRKIYDEIITINPFELLGAPELEQIQLTLLAFMNKREIVIEALPTSNIRIGFHRDFSSYHLWTWLNWRKEGKSIPPIVIGTDDTGIFATNIYNEYANLYCSLLNRGKKSHLQIMEEIKRLNEAAEIYRFT